MNNKKYLVSLLFYLFLASIPAQTYPMAKRLAGRAKIALSGGLTLAHWYLAASSCWSEGIACLKQNAQLSKGTIPIDPQQSVEMTVLMKALKIDRPLSPDAEKFIRKELEKEGVKNADTIRLIPGEFNKVPTYGTNTHMLFIPQNNYERMVKKAEDTHAELQSQNSQLTQKSKELMIAHFEAVNPIDDQLTLQQLYQHQKNPNKLSVVEKKLNAHRFALAHEAQHIKNNDPVRTGVAALAIPFITHAACRLLPFPASFWLQQAAKLPTGLVKGCTNNLGLLFFNRSLEQQADDGVRDDIDILRGGVRYFTFTDNTMNQDLFKLVDAIEQRVSERDLSQLSERRQNIARFALTQIQKFKKLPKEQQLKYFEWAKFLRDPIHPTPQQRSKRLNQRINELLAQEEEKRSTH